ncbi:uncharacterized protein [Solanum lycopersicum]|uniref:uncharacterized protein n=1 Tax=Solanum lycopersicum TaxID=4081 RepID=UPI003747984B
MGCLEPSNNVSRVIAKIIKEKLDPEGHDWKLGAAKIKYFYWDEFKKRFHNITIEGSIKDHFMQNVQYNTRLCYVKQDPVRRNKIIFQNLFGRAGNLTMILRVLRLNLHNVPKIDSVRNVVKDLVPRAILEAPELTESMQDNWRMFLEDHLILMNF